MLTTLWNLVDRLCQPCPTLFDSSIQKEIAFKRNKSVLFIQILGCLVFTFWTLATKSIPSLMQLTNLTILFTSTLMFLICCRSHPAIFKLFYFLIVTFYGPFLHFYYQDAAFFNFLGASVLPVWILCLSDSKILFLAQVGIQTTWLYFFGKIQLIETLERVSATYYSYKTVEMVIIGTLINSIFVLAIKFALDRAHDQAMTSKARSKELERQKTSILEFSHELRNLVNTITNTGKLCILEGVSVRVKDLLTSSQICGDLAIHLVNNVLDAGKMEISELEVAPQTNLVYNLLENIWCVSSQLINRKRLNGQMKVYKTVPPMLKLDNHRMIQILLNLVMNAIKFTERGTIGITVDWIENKEGVDRNCFEPSPFNEEDEGIFEKNEAMSIFRGDVITLGTNQGKVKLDPESREGRSQKGILKITVTDTGCGIASDQVSKLFKKFAQVNDDASKSSKGSGLGLFITKRLIKKMHGKIKVFSKVGKGSAFVACIPMEAMEINQKENL